MSNAFIFGLNDEVDGSWNMTTESAYGHAGGNVGNLVFHYAIRKILGGRPEVIAWHDPAEKVNKMGKIGVMPCANQLGPHIDFGSLADRFSALDVPLVAVGLGAQGNSDYGTVPGVPEGTQNWVRQIGARSRPGIPNIGVRGPFTLEVLNRYGLGEKAIITGCPSLFINPDPDLGQKIERRFHRPVGRIAVASGHYGWKQYSKIEASLTRMMESTGGSYIIQSPLEMVALARGESDMIPANILEQCRDYACPHLDLADFKAWTRRYFKVFFNVSEWMECMRSYDFVIGTRIHGIMVALQAGVPAMCIAHDSRTRELCETMHVPFILAQNVMNGMTREDLQKKFIFDGAAFDKNRKLLAERFDNFLLANGVEPSVWLKAIVK